MATIRKTRVYPYSIDEVWECLTDSSSLGRWLMENDFRPEVGHEFCFRTDPVPGFDGIVYCKVLTIDPPKELSISWRGGDVDTIVNFKLTEVSGGTRLDLKQTGFRPVKQFVTWFMLSLGWRKIIRKLLANELDSKFGATGADE